MNLVYIFAAPLVFTKIVGTSRRKGVHKYTDVLLAFISSSLIIS